jgi:hypothetical protein
MSDTANLSPDEVAFLRREVKVTETRARVIRDMLDEQIEETITARLETKAEEEGTRRIEEIQDKTYQDLERHKEQMRATRRFLEDVHYRARPKHKTDLQPKCRFCYQISMLRLNGGGEPR